jgi:hypothetical protein
MPKLLTISIPQAGRLVGECGRGASYEAARRGEIPTTKVGRHRRVPVRWVEEQLKLEPGTLTKEDLDRAYRHHNGTGGNDARIDSNEEDEEGQVAP